MKQEKLKTPSRLALILALAWFPFSSAAAADAQGLLRYDFRLEHISCARCILNVRQALRKTAGVQKCEIALRKPYGAVLIVDGAKVNEALIKKVVDSADPGTHPQAVDFLSEPVKTVPAVLLPKHNGLKKN